ncbi:MAG: hypothetical protein AAFV93_00220 [Chloroflexota bacterium]
MGDIDFSKGGYGGDVVETLFEDYTKTHLEYWWYFREVLRGSDRKSDYWRYVSNNRTLNNEEQKQLIAISLMNYAVVESISEAIYCINELQQLPNNELQFFNSRRIWKASYSSLNRGYNAIGNIVYVLLTKKPVLNTNNRNYSPQNAINKAESSNRNLYVSNLKKIKKVIQLRNHLDHYWIVWMGMRNNRLIFDKEFKKGKIVVEPSNLTFTDAIKRLDSDLYVVMNSLNEIYRELSKVDGLLDEYLFAKGWYIDYADFGKPHNGKRPQIK